MIGRRLSQQWAGQGAEEACFLRCCSWSWICYCSREISEISDDNIDYVNDDDNVTWDDNSDD